MPSGLRLLREFTHFFAVILWVAAALAFFAETRQPGGGMWQLGTAILAVILVNGVFSFLQEYRAERAIAALRAAAAGAGQGDARRRAAVAAGRGPRARRLVVLEGGDSVPADCRVVEARPAGQSRDDHRRVAGQGAQRGRHSRRRGAGEEPAARGHLAGLRRSARRGLRDRHAHGVREDRAPDADRRRDGIAAAAGDRAAVAPGGRVRGGAGPGCSSPSARCSACRSGRTRCSRSASSSRTCRRACCPP